MTSESAPDSARLFFQKARDEAVQRLTHREQELFVFMTFISGVVGLFITHPQWHVSLLLIPFLSLATALLLLQHDVVIGILARFQRVELHPHLDVSADAVQWERSESLNAYGPLVLAPPFLGRTFDVNVIKCVREPGSGTSPQTASSRNR